jgi:4-amino-4-deoxy-L-arabinose transferase-like glycosyltransferase
LLLLSELRDAWRDAPLSHRRALGLIVLLASALRLMYLGQPMRYDEAVTYMYFVRLPWEEALATYTYPNNHVFHTLLVKASVSAFGNEPWAIRLPAFLAGVAIVPATYAATRALYGDRAALFATAVVASAGGLVLYSTNARGYTMVVLAFLLLVLAGARLLRAPTTRMWIAFVLIATLGLWTIPVMLFPLGAVCVWLTLAALAEGKRQLLKPLLISVAAIGALTLLAYAPIISRSGLASVTRNRFVAPSGWYEFFQLLPRSLGDAVISWSLGLPLLVMLGVLLCALVALSRHVSLSTFVVGVPLGAFVWCCWLLVVTHRAPFARVWLWVLPLVAALAGAGLVLILERWPRTRRLAERHIPLLSVIYAAGAALSVVLSFAVLLSRDTGTYREAEEASDVLARVLRPGDRVLVGIPTNGPLEYYLHRRGVDPRHLTLNEASAQRVFAVVDRAEGQTLPMLVGRSPARDTGIFTPPARVVDLPASSIIVFQRRNVSTR